MKPACIFGETKKEKNQYCATLLSDQSDHSDALVLFYLKTMISGSAMAHKYMYIMFVF